MDVGQSIDGCRWLQGDVSTGTAARGSNGAVTTFEALFRTEYPRVVAAVRWVAADDGAAQEAAQEAFCRALERWDRVSRHDHPGAWVQVTALRFAVHHRRRDEKRRSLAPAWSPPPDLATVDLDVIEAVAALPAGQRAAVVLHHLLDLSVDDAAAVLGVRAGTVKTQLHRARLRLADALGEARPEEVCHEP
jgi:RNA polymerase sigma-70 factor (ECF subfamily)